MFLAPHLRRALGRWAEVWLVVGLLGAGGAPSVGAADMTAEEVGAVLAAAAAEGVQPDLSGLAVHDLGDRLGLGRLPPEQDGVVRRVRRERRGDLDAQRGHQCAEGVEMRPRIGGMTPKTYHDLSGLVGLAGSCMVVAGLMICIARVRCSTSRMR